METFLSPATLIQAALTFGVAWGGVKTALNGMEKRQASMEEKIDKLVETTDIQGNRLTRVETLLEVKRDT